MRKPITLFNMLLGAILLLPIPASAAIINFTASLSGLQEVPPNASPGTGSATVNYDDVTGILDWNISYSDLTAAATAGHFHGPAAPGTNAGVQVALTGVSGISGTVIGSAAITGTQATDLIAGLWYINIHTSTFPGGEIRGQVVSAVPLPGAAWLLFSGLSGVMLLARRKSRG